MCILYVNIVMSVKISLKLMFIVFIYARVGLKIKLVVFCKFCICICICHSFPAPCPFRWRNIVHVVLEETKIFVVYSALVCSFGYALFVQALPLYIELDLDVDTVSTRQIPGLAGTCTWVHPRFLVGFVLLDL